jgi:hypothetical protein
MSTHAKELSVAECIGAGTRSSFFWPVSPRRLTQEVSTRKCSTLCSDYFAGTHQPSLDACLHIDQWPTLYGTTTFLGSDDGLDAVAEGERVSENVPIVEPSKDRAAMPPINHPQVSLPIAEKIVAEAERNN